MRQDNYEKIVHMSREDLAELINVLIDEGNHLIADDLWNSGKKNLMEGSQEEVLEWLKLNTIL